MNCDCEILIMRCEVVEHNQKIFIIVPRGTLASLNIKI